MSTLTKEQQKQILIDTANHVINRDNTSPHSENMRELARIALASLEAEKSILYRERNPYNGLTTGWQELTDDEYEFIKDNAGENAEFRTVYTAPQAPVSVPDDVSGPLAHAYKELTPTFMRNHIDVFERYGIYPDGSVGIQAMRIALDGMNRRAAMLQGADGKPELTVWYGAMPETNGKTNWTAILHRKGECISTGITIDRSEYPDRTRYEADRMRYLIGEISEEPDILAYDADAHSGYVKTGNSPVIPDGWVMVPVEPTMSQEFAGYRTLTDTGKMSRLMKTRVSNIYRAMLAAAPQQEV